MSFFKSSCVKNWFFFKTVLTNKHHNAVNFLISQMYMTMGSIILLNTNKPCAQLNLLGIIYIIVNVFVNNTTYAVKRMLVIVAKILLNKFPLREV